MLAEQLEAQEILLDLTIAPFEPLTPGNGQNIGEKKEKLANAICPRYGVLGYRGGRFRGIVQVRRETRQAEHHPVEAQQCPSRPLYHPCQPRQTRVERARTT